jgi:hypothetical protein
MKERAQELKAAARRSPRGKEADEESAVLAKIAEMHYGPQGPAFDGDWRLPDFTRAE